MKTRHLVSNLATCALIFCGCRPHEHASQSNRANASAPAPASGISSNSSLTATIQNVSNSNSIENKSINSVTNIAIALTNGTYSVASILYSISNDFRGKRFAGQWGKPSESELLTENLILKLGLHAESNDQAYSFLQIAANPHFWKSVVNWRSPSEPDNYACLAGRCISAIGLSGRPDALAKLRAIPPEDLVGFADGAVPARLLDGAVIDAAFYASIIQGNGRGYLGEITRSGNRLREFGSWLQSPEGIEWSSWSKEFVRQHRSGP